MLPDHRSVTLIYVVFPIILDTLYQCRRRPQPNDVFKLQIGGGDPLEASNHYIWCYAPYPETDAQMVFAGGPLQRASKQVLVR